MWSRRRWLSSCAALTLLVPLGVVSAAAQMRVTTLDDVRREIAPGDVVSVMQTTGAALKGRLLRFGDADLEIRTDPRSTGGQQEVAIPLTTLQSLERPRDSSQNGALIGAAIGGGVVGAASIWAFAVDANEADEWGPGYALAGGILAGIGGLVGWAIDHAHSKPYVRYDAPARTAARMRVVPLASARGGHVTLRLAVSF